jgi:hypothetical protein
MASKKLVLANYLAHWQNSTGHWLWDGWKWNDCGVTHNPNNFKPDGTHDIASIYYPLIGPYDDRDAAIQQYHIRLAEASGIDAFIVDWYGITDHGDFPTINSNFRSMLSFAEKVNFGLAVDYDAYRFYLGGTGPDYVVIPNRTLAIRQVHDDLAYVIQQYGQRSAYLKFNGKPVIFVFGSTVLKPSEWGTIFQQLENEGLKAHYIRFFADVAYYPYFTGFFPWIEAHGVAEGTTTPISYIHNNAEELKNFADSNSITWGMNVWPGFDSTPVADWCYGQGRIQIDRKGGTLYNQTWAASMSEEPSSIDIATFNDWNEGTIIEPTVQFGYQYLYATAYFSAKFKNLQSSYGGIPVPFLIYNATLAIRQAQTDGRFFGLDAANQTLQQAEQAFQSGQYSDATRLAKWATMLALQTTTSPSATSSSTSYTLSMPLPPISVTQYDMTYAAVVAVIVILVAVSVIALMRKRKTKRGK